MRKRTLFNRFALAAILAGSIAIAGQAQAYTDFDALLADVDFGGAAAEVEEATGSASDATELTVVPVAPQQAAEAPAPIVDPAPNPVAEAPASEALTLPPNTSETLPVPPQPIQATQAPVSAQASSCGGQCGSQCGSQCGGKCGLKGHQFIKEGSCQPYTPPRLPTSTFYQYWRSNACNTQLWDGYRNRCHSSIDLSIHHNKRGCGCGGCDNIVPVGTGDCVDCGPAPAEWFKKAKCDSPACDSCDR